MKVFWIWVKSWFRCQHLACDLHPIVLMERLDISEEHGDEVWMCSCTCTCGAEDVEQKFAFSTSFLNRTFMPSPHIDGQYIRKS